MNPTRFDRLARTLFSMNLHGTRRATIGLGLAALSLLAARNPPATGARNKRKRKHKRKCKKCGPCQRCNLQKGKCKPTKAGAPCGNGKQCFPNGACQACDVCASGCPHTSLPDAIDAATDGATIQLCPGAYPTRAEVTTDLTIVGAGSGRGGTSLDGQKQGRVLLITDSIVTLRRLTITGGVDGIAGGGIFASDSELTLEDVLVTGNEAAVFGGGIASGESTTTLIASRVTGNSAGDGGGIVNTGTLTLTRRSSVTGNTATAADPSSAGGILNLANGTVSVSPNSRVTGNTPDNCSGTAAC